MTVDGKRITKNRSNNKKMIIFTRVNAFFIQLCFKRQCVRLQYQIKEKIPKMGSAIQKSVSTTSANGEPTPEIVALTNVDVENIRRTWKIPSANPHDSGSLIFYTFLEKYPHNQQKFPAFKDKPLEDLRNTVEFRAHASRIFNVFSSVIDGLDKDTEMMKGIKKIIAEVGKFHAKKKVTKKSQNEVRSVIVDVLTDVCKLSDDEKASWTKLLNIFFHVMFECIDGRAEQFL